jgi:hypothetical protein
MNNMTLRPVAIRGKKWEGSTKIKKAKQTARSVLQVGIKHNMDKGHVRIALLVSTTPKLV